MRSLNRATRARSADWVHRRRVAQALLVLAGAGLAVRLLPFRRAIRLGSRRLSSPPPGEGAILVDRTVRSVTAAAGRAPWRAVCIHRGLAVQWLLRRSGVDAILHYGAGIGDGGELQAHVWVTVAGEAVTGGEEAARFQCLATFP